MRKVYQEMQNTMHEGTTIIRKGMDWMKRNILEREPKPPNKIKEFWKIFVKSCDNTFENQKELEEKHLELERELQKVKKYNWIPIVVAIVVAVFTCFNWCLHMTDVNLHHIEVDELLEEKLSHVIAFEEIKWMGEYQLYMLHFENRGEIENNLLIEVRFPSNCSIDKSSPYYGKYQLVHENITWLNTFYTAFYSNIRENQPFSVRLDVYNDDLINNSSLKILPSYIGAWTDKGQVTIYPSE